MEKALFGRMRNGRCITAEEIDAQRSLAGGNDPRILGCSADVLDILNRKCSGKTECEVRVVDISAENIRPCFPGLSVYLEVSYNCITVVDEQRSCVVTASNNPTHILPSSFNQRVCGTNSQPWIIEAPVGQQIIITSFNFVTRNLTDAQKQRCLMYGTIIDKAGKRNLSICANELQRETTLYNSTGHALDIILYSDSESDRDDYSTMFILKLKAIGCSDIIPPEDTWLKRNGDRIIIGCYSNRIAWHLVCINDRWIGSLGNCTYGSNSEASSYTETVNNVTDEWRNTLIIICIAVASLVITVLIITFGVCLFTRLKESHRHRKAKAKGTKKKVTFARNSQDAVLNTGNPNIRPQRTAREMPISYREPAYTSSMLNLLSHAQTNNSATKSTIISGRNKEQTELNYEIMPLNLKPGSTVHNLVPNESNNEPPYLDLAESFRRWTPNRSQESNSTTGYLLPNELRSQSRRHEYLDLVDYNTIHPSVSSPDKNPESGYLVPNKFKPLSRAHDYLDLVDNPTLPRGRPHDSKSRYLLPIEFRSQARRHDYLDLIDYYPNHSSLRRRHSDPFSGYLMPNELRQQVYTNDYMHLVERDLDCPGVYAFLRTASAAAPRSTNNQ